MRQQNTQKKNNRRSILVIGLLLMLVAVIGFGGYTLSKYVTKKDTSANASVAKWGFTVTTEEDKLFGTNYKFTEANSVVTTDSASLTVKSSDTNKRVAPGTTGSMTFSIKGKAEVLASINLQMTNTKDVVLKYTNNGVAGTDYAPVKWTLTKSVNGAEATNVVENKTLGALAVELNKEFVNKEINAGAEINVTYTLTWAWAFTSGDENDTLDTLLGMTANETSDATIGNYKVATGTTTEVGFNLTISIEQLQKPASSESA